MNKSISSVLSSFFLAQLFIFSLILLSSIVSNCNCTETHSGWVICESPENKTCYHNGDRISWEELIEYNYSVKNYRIVKVEQEDDNGKPVLFIYFLNQYK